MNFNEPDEIFQLMLVADFFNQFRILTKELDDELDLAEIVLPIISEFCDDAIMHHNLILKIIFAKPF